MKTQFILPAISKLLLMGVVGVILVVVTSLTAIQTLLVGFRQQAAILFDQAAYAPVNTTRSLIEGIVPTTKYAQTIVLLEQKNRQLYAQLAACNENVPAASQSAVTRSVLPEETAVPSRLSFAGGQWILLSGSAQHIQTGNIVIQDEVFLGVVASVHTTYSEVVTALTSPVPLLVQHEKSKASAIARTEKGKMTVQFSKLIDTVTTGDVLVTIPDGATTTRSYPIAVVSEIISNNADSVTRIHSTPIAVPVIGSWVHVLGSRK